MVRGEADGVQFGDERARDEGVGEREAARVDVVHLDEALGECRLEALERDSGGEIGHAGQDVQVESSTDHCGDHQDRLRVRRQP